MRLLKAHAVLGNRDSLGILAMYRWSLLKQAIAEQEPDSYESLTDYQREMLAQAEEGSEHG